MTNTNEEVEELKRTIEILESKLHHIALSIKEALKKQKQPKNPLVHFILEHVQKIKHNKLIEKLEDTFWSPPNGIRYKELNEKYQNVIVD